MAKILKFIPPTAPTPHVWPANVFEINQAASLATIGALINEAMSYDLDGDLDCVREILSELHGMIYPNATQRHGT